MEQPSFLAWKTRGQCILQCGQVASRQALIGFHRVFVLRGHCSTHIVPPVFAMVAKENWLLVLKVSRGQG